METYFFLKEETEKASASELENYILDNFEIDKVGVFSDMFSCLLYHGSCVN